MKYEQLFPILVLIVLLVITIFFTLGFYFYFKARKKVKYWHRAKGLVVDLKPKGSSRGGTLYSPKVKFVAKDSREIEFVEWWSSSPPQFKTGEEVTVLYHPKNFSQACVLMSKQIMYFPGWLFLLLGGVFLLVGILLAGVFGTVFYFLGPPGQKQF